MKRNKKHENRVRKMVVACSLSAIVLTASTYAWFIGMKTVNVAPFEVNIAAIDGLALSLDGQTWQDTVSINGKNYNESSVVGENSHNTWSQLIPMSSVGVINTTSSNLELYEKGSLTPTTGGYRLLASPVNNRTAFGEETRGYVAFDLFVKNLSGNAYYDEFNEKNEEAIYLTTESSVKVSDAGADAKKTGIENSVRVAFAQIGRIQADIPSATGANARAIACNSGTAGDAPSVAICSRKATIWEPNDVDHVDNAISWYNQSCKLRTNTNEYGLGCNTAHEVKQGTANITYAIAKEIKEDYTVDIYDGANYNGYTSSIEKGFLQEMDYFTDTEKNATGTARQKFMTLAPKSVTKVRVYIYLEGQDVDNYDFASLGKKVSVSFGFTKERFTGQDIEYTGDPILPDDVQKFYTLKYPEGQSTSITEVTNGVTFSTNHFEIPRGVTEFTFSQDGQPKTATILRTDVVDGNKYAVWQIN